MSYGQNLSEWLQKFRQTTKGPTLATINVLLCPHVFIHSSIAGETAQTAETAQKVGEDQEKSSGMCICAYQLYFCQLKSRWDDDDEQH